MVHLQHAGCHRSSLFRCLENVCFLKMTSFLFLIGEKHTISPGTTAGPGALEGECSLCFLLMKVFIIKGKQNCPKPSNLGGGGGCDLSLERGVTSRQMSRDTHPLKSSTVISLQSIFPKVSGIIQSLHVLFGLTLH